MSRTNRTSARPLSADIGGSTPHANVWARLPTRVETLETRTLLSVSIVTDHPLATQPSGPTQIVQYNGSAYFVAYAPSPGFWQSDGTSAGTSLIRPFNGPVGFGSDRGEAVSGGVLYLSAAFDGNGTELWKTDGTPAGTVLLKDINPGPASSSPKELTDVNGTLFFTANEPTHGWELWKSDGTGPGTVLIKDIVPSTASSSSPQELTNVDGTLFIYCAAWHRRHGAMEE